MSLICKDGISPCRACGYCFEYEDHCSACHRSMAEGEKYYKLERKIICKDCTDTPEGEKCILCRKPASDGIRYGDIILCRSCSGVATGYISYI